MQASSLTKILFHHDVKTRLALKLPRQRRSPNLLQDLRNGIIGQFARRERGMPGDSVGLEREGSIDLEVILTLNAKK